MPFAPRVLSDEDLRALGIAPQEIVDSIAAAIRDQAAGRLVTTPKSMISPGEGRYMMTTLSSGAVTVVKVVSAMERNAALGLPSITGAIMVLDAQTGVCLAVMDAAWITAMRTAGLSAVAAARLAGRDSAVIGFVGCGVQARSHLDVFAALYPLTTALCFGRGSANVEGLCAKARAMGLDARAMDSADAVLEAADIVVSSVSITYEGAPFLDARRLKQGAFAAVTDAAKPWLPEGLQGFGAIYVDDRKQEQSRPQPMVSQDRIAGDLGDLVGGDVPSIPGPRGFLFRGIAAGDYALSTLVWERLEGAPNR